MVIASLAAYQETHIFCGRRTVPGPNGKSNRAPEKVFGSVKHLMKKKWALEKWDGDIRIDAFEEE